MGNRIVDTIVALHHGHERFDTSLPHDNNQAAAALTALGLKRWVYIGEHVGYIPRYDDKLRVYANASGVWLEGCDKAADFARGTSAATALAPAFASIVAVAIFDGGCDDYFANALYENGQLLRSFEWDDDKPVIWQGHTQPEEQKMLQATLAEDEEIGLPQDCSEWHDMLAEREAHTIEIDGRQYTLSNMPFTELGNDYLKRFCQDELETDFPQHHSTYEKKPWWKPW